MPAIEVKNLTHIYSPGTPYEKKALDDVSLCVGQGQVLGIVGGNGSGKTTLVKHFNGLLAPSSGDVTVLGRDVSVRQYRNELWKDVGMVFQFPEQQIFEETVFEEIAFGLRNLGMDKNEIQQRVCDSLEKVGLFDGDMASTPPISLSGGMRRRVALASILAMEPRILIMDEPTAGLDANGRKSILEAIREIKNEQKTLMIVSHHISELIPVCTHLAVMEKGRLVACGTLEEVLKSGEIQDTEELLLPEYLQLVRRMAVYRGGINTGISRFEEAEEEMFKFFRGLL